MIPRSRMFAALALILVAGCSSTAEEPSTQQMQPLALKEQASSVAKGDGGYVVSWAGVLGNSNPWHFGENVVATIVGIDAKGAEVLRMDQPLDAVPPSGTLAFTGQAVTGAKPERVTITHRSAQWRQVARIPSSLRKFPVSRVQTIKQKDGTYLVTGDVGNPYVLPASSLTVSALLRDRSGKLLGGASTFVDDVRAGKTPRFILTVEGLPASTQVARTEVVARTWGSTGRPYEELAVGGAVPVHTVKPSTPPFAKDRGRYAVTAENKP
ncbi:hypothetical protein [Nonomuraea africana]|uniref:Lipoprotein n=1 Tax=Nonomuraea africana TaxID=46171 RepID=A0ABR9KQ66_9ACTN|nr:hypothetical protein [Nonomuraea africana]MBE1564167.1 hypothetical protein [Nonomuraea africana]